MKHILLLIPILLAAGPMYAQSDPADAPDTLKTYQIDDVVVTGTRTYRKIIDVPYSVQRVENVQFKFERKSSVSDVLGGIPGVFLQNRYGNHDVRISIRGFGSRSNSGIRGVRILLDGIPESEPDGQTRIEAIDFQSVGSIELVKGNSSSLYTNAPGGVINFINDINFTRPSALQFNEFGSFGLHSHGFKVGLESENLKFLTTYSYRSAKGYRPHSEDRWNILNTVLRLTPDRQSQFNMYGYFVEGVINLPGSLTKGDYDADPLQANSRDVGRDAKRTTTKGRVGLQYLTYLDEDRNNELEVTAYGTIKYFHRTAATYRIITRYGVGGSSRFIHRGTVFNRTNEFSIGGDLLYQAGPVEDYVNIGGVRGDGVQTLTDETISNTGFYLQNSFPVLPGYLDLLITGRYDKVVFDISDKGLDARSNERSFDDFTPKIALNYKISPLVAAYSSYGWSFDSPAANEMANHPLASTYPKVLNPNLQPQKSRNFELGIKGNLLQHTAEYFRSTYFDVTFFDSNIDDEIVPFEIDGNVFFRNAANTSRRGLEAGVSTEVLRGLRAKVAYTLSDFKYNTYGALVTSIVGDTTETRFDGNTPPSIPKHNLSLTLSYEHHLSEGVIGFIKGNYLNVSGMYTDDGNTEKSDGYQLLNSTIGFDILVGRFNILLSGGVNNIFDLSHVAFININSTRKEFYEAGEPRNYFAGINLAFTI